MAAPLGGIRAAAAALAAALALLTSCALPPEDASQARADRRVFLDVSLEDWFASQVGPADGASVPAQPPELLAEKDGLGSAAFAALVGPLLPPGAVLCQHSHMSADGLQLDEAWYQLPDGAVLLVSRNFVGPDYSVPVDAVLMGRPGGVESWGDDIEAVVSSTSHFAEITAATNGWIFTLAAQEGPVWFGEGRPPAGFFQRGRRGVVPELSVLRNLAQELIHTEGVLYSP